MAEETQSLDSKISISRIAEGDFESLSDFVCGVELIDQFFQSEIETCYKYRYVTPYKCINVDSGEIMGAFTLSNDIIQLPDDEINAICIYIPEYAEIFMKQASYPAINIGHLAIRQNLQRKGIGRAIMEFVRMTFYNNRMSGCQFLTVDALNIDGHRTPDFYERIGFELLSEKDIGHSTRRMYLPLFDMDIK